MTAEQPTIRWGHRALEAGPNDHHHGWRHPLEPGAEFRTVPVALAHCADGGPGSAFAALTRYHRAARRQHSDRVGEGT